VIVVLLLFLLPWWQRTFFVHGASCDEDGEGQGIAELQKLQLMAQKGSEVEVLIAWFTKLAKGFVARGVESGESWGSGKIAGIAM